MTCSLGHTVFYLFDSICLLARNVVVLYVFQNRLTLDIRGFLEDRLCKSNGVVWIFALHVQLWRAQ
jgi:hypothetical protein